MNADWTNLKNETSGERRLLVFMCRYISFSKALLMNTKPEAIQHTPAASWA